MNSVLLVLLSVATAIVVPAVVEVLKDWLLRRHAREEIRNEFQRETLIGLRDAVPSLVRPSVRLYQARRALYTGPHAGYVESKVAEFEAAHRERSDAWYEFAKFRSTVADKELRSLLDEWSTLLTNDAEITSAETAEEPTDATPLFVEVMDRIGMLLNERY